MDILIYFLVFIFGAVIGSFLNVVILRYNTGISICGRSFCFSCRRQLSWRELFPVISFLALRGRCRFCESKISWQYTIVEILTGILFVLAFWHMGGVDVLVQYTIIDNLSFIYFSELFFVFVAISLLVITGVYDYKHQIIPDAFAYAFAALAFSRVLFLPDTFYFTPGLWDIVAGPVLALPFFLLWFFSKGKWMGLGDAKLMLGIGWFLGISAGFSAMVLAFWIGAIVSLSLMLFGKMRASLFSKRLTFHSEIPFAPFLLIGFGLVFFFPGLSVAVCHLFL